MDISLSRRHFIATAMVAALLAPNVLFADDSEVPGEVILSTPFEFVKFSVNGKSAWENHEYTKRNKTLVIMGLARDQENEIVLTPRVEGYQPYTLVVKPSEYKRRKVRVRGRRVVVYRVSKRVKFKKVAPAAPKAAPKATPKAGTKAKK